MGKGQTWPDPGNPDQQILVTFQLDRQTYALPIAHIAQIVEMVTITPVPQAGPAVEGVIHVRGAAVPVVNLRRHFGLPESPLQLHTPIILVETGRWTVGLIVDEVLDVLQLPVAQIARPADVLPADLEATPILQGLARTPGGTLLLLDLEHLFRPDQAQALAQVIAALREKDSSSESGSASAVPAPEPIVAAQSSTTLEGEA